MNLGLLVGKLLLRGRQNNNIPERGYNKRPERVGKVEMDSSIIGTLRVTFYHMADDSELFSPDEQEKIRRIGDVISGSNDINFVSFYETLKILKEVGCDDHPIMVSDLIYAWRIAFPGQQGSIIQCITHLGSYDSALFTKMIEGLTISLLMIANCPNPERMKNALSLMLCKGFVQAMSSVKQTPAGMDALSTPIRNLATSLFPNREVSVGDKMEMITRREVIRSFGEILSYGTRVPVSRSPIPFTEFMLVEGLLDKPGDSLAHALLSEWVSTFFLNFSLKQKVDSFLSRGNWD